MKRLGRVRVAALASLGVLSLLAGCDQKPIAGPRVFEPSETALHQIGRFDGVDKTLVSQVGERGMLAYGPYAELAPGHYEATFVISSGPGAASVGKLDVNAFTAARQTDVLATLPIPPNLDKAPLKLSFDSPPGVKLEFRVFSGGTATVALHRTQVRKL